MIGDGSQDNQGAPAPPAPYNERLLQSLRRLVGWGFRTTARFRHRSCPEDADVTPPSPHSAKPLIVMIHGFQGDPAEFCQLHAYLRHALGEQFDFAVIDNLDPGMDPSPDENCLRIAAYLFDHGLESRELYLIGHSMGGLVARRFPQLAEKAVVKAMVLVATPNGGVNGWNLLPIHWLRSKGFHDRINTNCPANPSIRYFLVGGTRGANFLEGQLNDGVVGLWSVLRFIECNESHAAVNVHTYPCDHWGLLRSKPVAHDIAEFLRDALNSQG